MIIAKQKYFIIPAADCVEAIALYELAKEDALTAKRALLAKYGAEAIMRAGDQIHGFAWRSEPAPLPGFTSPKLNKKFGVWVRKPKKSTKDGKLAANEMAEVGELLEIWQWSLERALGIHGTIFGCLWPHRQAFLNAVAKALPDGRVVACIPIRDEMESKDSARDTDPKIPANAVEITKNEGLRLMEDPELEVA